MCGGSGRQHTLSTVLPPSRQASIILGFAPSTMGKGVPNSFHPMGNFGTGGASKLSSEDRFNASHATSVSGAAGMQFQRPMALARIASSGPSATWANKSEDEKDGRMLIQVIKLVFEKATDEATWSEMCARCSPWEEDDGADQSQGPRQWDQNQ